MKPNDKKKKYFADPSLGWVMGVAMLTFAFLGYLADEKWGRRPWGVIGGIVLGLVYCVYEVWKSIKKIDES